MKHVPPALLARVLEAPEDDAPRLVVADHLLASGDPARGELITLQCAIAADDRATGNASGTLAGFPTPAAKARLSKTKRLALDREARKLLKAHEERWTAEAGWPADYRCTFARGFVDAVEAHGPLSTAQKALDESPVRALTIMGHDALTELIDHPVRRRLRAVTLTNTDASPAEIRALGDGARLAEIQWRVSPLEPEVLAALATWPVLERFAAMSVRRLPASIAEALTAPPFRERLTRIDLRGDEDRTKEVAPILARAPFRSLTELTLVSLGIDCAGAEALARSQGMKRLVRLNLALNSIATKGLRAIATSAELGRLRHLDLAFNSRIGDGLKVLADPTHLPALERLIASYVPLSDAARKKLTTRFGKNLIS